MMNKGYTVIAAIIISVLVTIILNYFGGMPDIQINVPASEQSSSW